MHNVCYLGLTPKQTHSNAKNAATPPGMLPKISPNFIYIFIHIITY
jgi:hypothetical protein